MAAPVVSCPHFPACSGCSAIGWPYDGQLAAKLRAVQLLFAEAGLSTVSAESIRSITASPETAGYRNRVRLVPLVAHARRPRPAPPLADAPDPQSGGDGDRRGSSAPGVGTARGAIDRISLGLFRASSHDVIDIPYCPVQTDAINHAVEVIRASIARHGVALYDEAAHRGDLRYVSVRHGVGTDELLVGLVTREERFVHAEPMAREIMAECGRVVGVVQNVNGEKGNVIFGSISRVLAGRGWLEEIVCGVRIRLGLTSFFQINTPVAERAYEAIVARAMESQSGCAAATSPAPTEASQPARGQAACGVTLLDLYAGVGTIGLVAASRGCRVYGIEESSEAVELASAAGEVNGLDNIKFRSGLVEDRLPDLTEALRTTRANVGEVVVVVNPPRKGLGESIVDLIVETGAQRIAYLSCAPKTLIRDLRGFEHRGYGVRSVELFDMFPQTPQVETLAVLVRADRGV